MFLSFLEVQILLFCTHVKTFVLLNLAFNTVEGQFETLHRCYYILSCEFCFIIKSKNNRGKCNFQPQ